MATSFLDLDPLHKPLGHVQLDGTQYAIYPMTVKNMINLAAFEQQAGDLQDGSRELAVALEVLAEVIPDCPQGRLAALNVPQLNALMEHVRQLGEEGARKNSPAPRKGRRST